MLLIWAGDVGPIAEKDLGLKRANAKGPEWILASIERAPGASRSKAGYASFDGFSGLLDLDAEGNGAIGVDDRELSAFLPHWRLSEFLLGGVDVHDLVWL